MQIRIRVTPKILLLFSCAMVYPRHRNFVQIHPQFQVPTNKPRRRHRLLNLELTVILYDRNVCAIRRITEGAITQWYVYFTLCRRHLAASSLSYYFGEVIACLWKWITLVRYDHWYKKSCCLRIGRRNHVSCANTTILSGHPLPWTSEMRYLGVYIVCSCKFKCSFEAAKRSFYRAANSIWVRYAALHQSGNNPTTFSHAANASLLCYAVLKHASWTSLTLDR